MHKNCTAYFFLHQNAVALRLSTLVLEIMKSGDCLFVSCSSFKSSDPTFHFCNKLKDQSINCTPCVKCSYSSFGLFSCLVAVGNIYNFWIFFLFKLYNIEYLSTVKCQKYNSFLLGCLKKFFQ